MTTATKQDIRCPFCRSLHGRTDLTIEVVDSFKDAKGHRHIEMKCQSDRCRRMFWVVSK